MSKTSPRKSLLFTLAAVLAAFSIMSLSTGAQKSPAATPAPSAAPAEPAAANVTPAPAAAPASEVAKAEPTSDEVASYLEIYGWMVGQQAGFEMGFSDVEKDALMKGLEKAASGEKAPENMKEAFPKMQEYLSNKEKAYRAVMMAKMEEESKAHIADGEKFLADIAKKDGVKKTESGLYYKIETPGTGAQPAADDVVNIHYTGKLIDGTVFDSSVERGTPVDLPLYGVIPGFSEGVRLLKEGGKATLYIPANLAYGSQAAGPIPPGSTLVFSVELIKVQPKEAAAEEAKADEAEEEAAPAAEAMPAEVKPAEVKK